MRAVPSPGPFGDPWCLEGLVVWVRRDGNVVKGAVTETLASLQGPLPRTGHWKMLRHHSGSGLPGWDGSWMVLLVKSMSENKVSLPAKRYKAGVCRPNPTIRSHESCNATRFCYAIGEGTPLNLKHHCLIFPRTHATRQMRVSGRM